MKIGKISEITGLSIDTIRYYEKRGLITKPERRYSGYRIFKKQHIDELHFIKRAHGLGFTLNEVKNLMALRFDERSGCTHLKQKARVKYQRITAKIYQLEKIRDELVELTESCRGDLQINQCPVLNPNNGGHDSGKI